jgi:hypothetical protein
MNSNILHHVRAKTPGPQGKGEARGRFFPQACFFPPISLPPASRSLAYCYGLLKEVPPSNAVQHRFHEAELLQMARSGSPAASTLSTTSAVLPTAMFSRFRRLLERVGITHVSPSVRRCCIQLPICRFADHYPPVSVARFEPQSLLTPLRSSTERTRPGSPRSLQTRPVARSTARPFG